MNKKKFLLTGDSITWSFDTLKLLPEFNIINKGIPGNNSTHLLKRLKRDLLASNPGMVFILIGTNDIAQGCGDSEISANIRSIMMLTTEYVPVKDIFITSILPTRNNQPRPNKRILELNKKIKIIADEFKVNYLDLYPLFADETDQLIVDLTEDGLHLNEKAYERWAQFLRQLLNEKLGASS
jgi:lysophospholipase L1-like esterase